ncbi:subtilase family serine protease [Planomicrobium stackebrandtii]|uniref:Subtilase family serine protease n=1 Tax=Planomicrobium stackebrandtii TaxID=253160 RepID=A0ABU0GT48_9BACL|nr:hypothetical protein [Planomicrobium stackebrandtii]MDQ0428536.1 subtilase family serine protease [Planomicrobium stackebrandtii]
MNESKFYDIVKEVENEMGGYITQTSVNGFSVEIECKSNSGKQRHTAKFEFDKNTGDSTTTFAAYPNSGTYRYFRDEVRAKMRKELNN